MSLEKNLAALTDEQLRRLAEHELPGLAAAAQAELARRPRPEVDELAAQIFPNSSR